MRIELELREINGYLDFSILFWHFCTRIWQLLFEHNHTLYFCLHLSGLFYYAMFVLAELKDTIRIPPWLFKIKLQETVCDEINRKLANKVGICSFWCGVDFSQLFNILAGPLQCWSVYYAEGPCVSGGLNYITRRRIFTHRSHLPVYCVPTTDWTDFDREDQVLQSGRSSWWVVNGLTFISRWYLQHPCLSSSHFGLLWRHSNPANRSPTSVSIWGGWTGMGMGISCRRWL